MFLSSQDETSLWYITLDQITPSDLSEEKSKAYMLHTCVHTTHVHTHDLNLFEKSCTRCKLKHKT